MKGIIFRALEELVVTNYGMDQWERLLEQSNLVDRYFLGPKSYPDEELIALVTVISSTLNKPQPELIRDFGQYLFGFLSRSHKDLVDQFDRFDTLIEGIDGIIHKEVEKLYAEPNLPSILVQRISNNELHITYDSPRKLCFCAEGLIHGAASYFGTDIHLVHETCTHQGAEHCTFRVTLTS